jgi:hypothetical protein
MCFVGDLIRTRDDSVIHQVGEGQRRENIDQDLVQSRDSLFIIRNAPECDQSETVLVADRSA